VVEHFTQHAPTGALIATEFKEKAEVLIEVSETVRHGLQCSIELSQIEHAATH
jgi:hypothetical protein